MAFDLNSAKDIEERPGFDLASAKDVDKVEPGWLQPGSKTDAALRGFSNAATFGFGDEIQAGVRALVADPEGKQGYMDRLRSLLKEEREKNQSAAKENPMSYIGGNLVGALPQGLSMARGALLGGPTLAGQMGGGLATSAKLAVPNVVGNADTSKPGWGKEAAVDFGIQTAAGALAPVIPAALSKTVPAAKYAANKAFPGIFPKGSQTVEEAITATRRASPGLGDLVANTVSLPVAGAIAGAAGREFMPGMSEDKIPWSPDPAAAAADRALYAGAGAGLGVAARMGGGMIKDASIWGANKSIPVIQKAFSAAGTTADDFVRKGEDAARYYKPTFKTMDELLHGAEQPRLGPGGHSGAAGAGGAPKAQPGVSEVEGRQIEMNRVSTKQGREQNNPDAKPVEETTPESLDDFFRQMRERPTDAMGMEDLGQAGDKMFGRLRGEEYVKELTDQYNTALREVIPDPDVDFDSYRRIMSRIQNDPEIAKVGTLIQEAKYNKREGLPTRGLEAKDLETAIEALKRLGK